MMYGIDEGGLEITHTLTHTRKHIYMHITSLSNYILQVAIH